MTDEGSPDEAARRRAETEARLRRMQFDQYTSEGGPPKARVGLVSAYVVSTLAAILPTRVRTLFAFGLNFVYNRVGATFRLLGAWLALGVTNVAVWMVYWLVIGPTALVARLLGQDDLRSRPVTGSNFTVKDPPDSTEARFQRQF